MAKLMHESGVFIREITEEEAQRYETLLDQMPTTHHPSKEFWMGVVDGELFGVNGKVYVDWGEGESL